VYLAYVTYFAHGFVSESRALTRGHADSCVRPWFAKIRLVLLSAAFFGTGACAAEIDLNNVAAMNQHESVSAATKPGASRVVFMGDSITSAWSEELFFAENPHFVNRGISGQTATQMLPRFRTDVIDLHPAIVHIMAGTNDVAENAGAERDADIEGAIASMAEMALAHHIKVIVASIPPAKDFPWHLGLNPAPRIKRLNDWLKSYAKRMNIVYLDYWPALATPDGGMKADVSDDGVHPNAEGYRRMQPLAQAAIKRLESTQASR
jgi:lysophospholipase L1-like esterase